MKQVKFAEDDSVALISYSDVPENPLWLVPDEYVALKTQIREDADALKPKGYHLLLKDCFDEVNKQRAQKHIDAFAQLPGFHCGRGCEMYLSRQHRESRDFNYVSLSTAVLHRQRVLKSKQAGPDFLADKLRSVSRKHSRSSRIFARRLGLADQRAARDGDDLVKAVDIVRELNFNGNAKKAMRKVSNPNDLCDMPYEDLPYEREEKGVAQMLGLSYGKAKASVACAAKAACHPQCHPQNYRPDVYCQRNELREEEESHHDDEPHQKRKSVPPPTAEQQQQLQQQENDGVVEPASSSAATSAGMGRNCANLIQSALDLLDLEDALGMDDSPF